MKKGINYQYYVEGENEKCLVNALKTDLRCIVAGKVEKFNVIQNKFTTARIRTLKPGTVVILLFDTDVKNVNQEILQSNIAFLKKQSAVKEVICIPQVKNLEEELVYSCNIKKFEELTHSGSKKDYKREFCACTNLGARLKTCGFSVEKIWSRKASGIFDKYENEAYKIKLKM